MGSSVSSSYLWRDHLSRSTLCLFQAVVTSTRGSLVVFVFFFSAGSSFLTHSWHVAAGEVRVKLLVCLTTGLKSRFNTSAYITHYRERKRSFPHFSVSMNLVDHLAYLCVWCGDGYWLMCKTLEIMFQPIKQKNNRDRSVASEGMNWIKIYLDWVYFIFCLCSYSCARLEKNR